MIKEDMSVELLDHMGSDIDIERAARLSYNRHDDERTIKQTEGLIRYLFWHRHTSPFEMVEFKFLLKIPIFVARQMVRHRTASLNELSRRYTNEDISFYNFELREVDNSKTKQGSGSTSDEDLHVLAKLSEELSFESYLDLISNKVSNETARVILPHSLMTTWIWKIDLHNLLHFLNLRLDSHAQKEIRIVANMILDKIKPIVPISISAFEDWKTMNDSFKEFGYDFFKNKDSSTFIKKMKLEFEYRSMSR